MMKNPISDLKNGGVDLYTSLTYTRVNTVLLLLLLLLLGSLLKLFSFHLEIEAAEGQVKTIPEKGKKK